TMSNSVYLARQPIFEAGRGLFGYELLYRQDGSAKSADPFDSHVMSAEVIVSALLGMGMSALTGDTVAFINFARTHLLENAWQLFDTRSIVIELLETVECDSNTIAACRDLTREGYRLALDDYVFDQSTLPLVEMASIVKIDVLAHTIDQLKEVTRQ